MPSHSMDVIHVRKTEHRVTSLKDLLKSMTSFLKDADAEAERANMSTWEISMRIHWKYASLENIGRSQAQTLEKPEVDDNTQWSIHLLETLYFGPSPQLQQVPSSIRHLGNLKSLIFIDMPLHFMDVIHVRKTKRHRATAETPVNIVIDKLVPLLREDENLLRDAKAERANISTGERSMCIH
ncbi:unnamed protein product [Prunus brigantina]